MDALNFETDFKYTSEEVESFNEMSKKLKEVRRESTPWIEKYRPRKIDDIILDKYVMIEVKNFIERKDMPNIILTGTPGIGKTTTIKCLAFAFYGKYYKNAVLELNASDDRGIKSVQNDVAKFCNSLLSYRQEDQNKYSKYKLIILDEADNITDKAQHLISDMMGKYHHSTRFAFTCNTSSDIIESIQSRCRILRYTRIGVDRIVERLNKISAIEAVSYDNDGLFEIANACQGDMRTAINLLQLTHNRHGNITAENVSNICEKPQPLIIKDILKHCLSGEFKHAVKKTLELKSTGYSGSDIVLSVIRALKLPIMDDIAEQDKIKIMNTIGLSAYNISKGVDTDIQLIGCIADLCRLK